MKCVGKKCFDELLEIPPCESAVYKRWCSVCYRVVTYTLPFYWKPKKKRKGKKETTKRKKKSNFTRFILIDWSLRFTGVYSRCQQRDELTGPRGRDSFWRQHFPPFLFFFNYLCAKRNNEDDVWRTRVNIRVQPEMERVGWASPKWIFFSFLF